MQGLEVSCAVRLMYMSLGAKGLRPKIMHRRWNTIYAYLKKLNQYIKNLNLHKKWNKSWYLVGQRIKELYVSKWTYKTTQKKLKNLSHVKHKLKNVINSTPVPLKTTKFMFSKDELSNLNTGWSYDVHVKLEHLTRNIVLEFGTAKHYLPIRKPDSIRHQVAMNTWKID